MTIQKMKSATQFLIAIVVLKILQGHPDLITWTEKLEVTFVNDQFCPGSSILDLLSWNEVLLLEDLIDSVWVEHALSSPSHAYFLLNRTKRGMRTRTRLRKDKFLQVTLPFLKAFRKV